MAERLDKRVSERSTPPAGVVVVEEPKSAPIETCCQPFEHPPMQGWPLRAGLYDHWDYEYFRNEDGELVRIPA